MKRTNIEPNRGEHNKICVIGAGASGLPAIKALAEQELPFDAFESSSVVGGLWVYDNPSGRSAAYRSLHINTSRERMAYADLPMPPQWPDFPHHSLIARYFADYAEAFDLRRHITFQTSVTHAHPRQDLWEIHLSSGEIRRYRALVVATGHHWDPRGPDPAPEGTFSGSQIHSHVYRDPSAPLSLVGKRVLVVGFGNSAMDIACELGHRGNAARVFLSVRTGGYVVPRYLLGRPLDTWKLPTWVPIAARQQVTRGLLRLAQGAPDRFGLPTPSFGALSAHPTVSSEILDRLGTGDVEVRPAIARLDGDRVHFVDGLTETVDAIVWCTGYKLTLPFFDRTFLDPSGDNRLDAYLRVWPVQTPPLAMVGFVQPLGAVMPIAERQAKIVADWLSGRFVLPERPIMEQEIADARARMARRYVSSKRHTIQVDFDDYMAALQREWDAGGARATPSRRARLLGLLSRRKVA